MICVELLFINKTDIPGTSYWQPVVARQFLRQSPFGRTMLPPRLLAQASSASLQPPSNRRREVKFAEAPITAEPAVWRGPRLQPELVPLMTSPHSPTPTTTDDTHTTLAPTPILSPWHTPLTFERTTPPHTTDFWKQTYIDINVSLNET